GHLAPVLDRAPGRQHRRARARQGRGAGHPRHAGQAGGTVRTDVPATSGSVRMRGVAFIWRLAVHTDRRRLTIAVVLLGIGYLATPFIGVLLKGLTNSALAGQTAVAVRYGVATAVLLVFELMMGHFAHLYYFELGEKMGAALDAELADRANATPG